MKTRLLYFLVFLVAIEGCNKIKDAATITISTKLKTDIPVVVTAVGMKAFNLVANVNSIAFSKTQDLSLESNADITPYISKVKEINLNSLLVTITGLSDGQTINSISLDVDGVGNIFTQTNITMANNSFTPVIAQEKLNQVGTTLTANRKITLTVSGNASGSMSFTVGLNIDSSVIAYVIN
jgi:hypothetical protein